MSVIKRGLKRYLPYILGIASAICVFGTYFVLTSTHDYLKLNFLFLFLYADIMLLFLLIFFVVKQIIRVLQVKHRHKNNGSKFQKQIITLFSCVTVIPAGCVFIFSVIFFNMGVESLFKAPVKEVIESANQVANIYVNETKNALENYAYGVGMQLRGLIGDVMIDNSDIDEILSNETSGLGIDAILFQSSNNFNEKNVIAKSPFALSVQFEDIPKEVLFLKGGEVFSWESKQLVIAIEAINPESGIYLMVSKNIDQKIFDHKHSIKRAIHEYTSIANQRTGLKITFITFFSGVILLLLMIVILSGIVFANKIVKPVNKLICAAKNVSLGNYNSPIVAPKFKNELDILISSFNIMVSKLEEQKKAIIISNRQNAWRDIARKIAHEIKNPLTPIQLSAERLKKKYANEITMDKDVFTMCVDTIIRQVHCIGNLVNEFSDFARMPAPKFETVDFAKIVKEAVFLQSNSNKNIKFHMLLNSGNSYVAYIDPFQINQVLINLLQNSINSIIESSKAGNVYVSLSTSKDNGYNLVVEDDGPGFSENALEHALDPYYTTRESGNGLGLAIVYKIIVEHGGVIELSNSEKHGGASVKIMLPSGS